MTARREFLTGAALLAAVLGLAAPVRTQHNAPGAAPRAGKLDAGRVGAAAGAKATTTPDGVVRVGWPRADVKVSVDGMPLKPFAALGSWAAFTAAKHGAMVMGDTVVFQDEVSPAMDAAFA